MNKSIKIKVSLSSNKENEQTFEYYIEDKKVSELEYYGISHLETADTNELKTALTEIRKQEPADVKLLYEWNTKCFLIQELLSQKGFFNIIF